MKPHNKRFLLEWILIDYYDTSNITSNSVRDAISQMKYTGGYTSLGLIIGMVSQLYDFKNINSRKVIIQHRNPIDLMYWELIVLVQRPKGQCDPNNEEIKVRGETGTTVIFQQNKCLHAASNTILNKRIAISFLIYPTLNKKLIKLDTKPINAMCSLSPFTKYTW